MDERLFTNESLEIRAPASRVWEVLTRARWIREWQEEPAYIADEELRLGSELLWRDAGGGVSVRGEVVAVEPGRRVSIAQRDAAWDAVAPDAFSCTYTLMEDRGATMLTYTMGDFARIPGGAAAFEASDSLENAELQKIRTLAEQAA